VEIGIATVRPTRAEWKEHDVGGAAMMTIVTHVSIESGQEPAWDAAWKERIKSAHTQPGWIAVQLGIPADSVNERVIIGTWETRADWEAWHATEAFQRTREQMEKLETEIRSEWWHEVLIEEHR
jgi:heme-degrading monooxygenase HmoA